MPKFSITTLGCKVNQAESESIVQDLIASEWCTTRTHEDAAVCVINTCAVTQKAAMQSRQAVRQAIRAHPNARVVVTGCYAQTAPQEIKDIAGVNCIVGHGEKQTISSMIRTDSFGDFNQAVQSCGDVSKLREFQLMPIAAAAHRTRPFLKIQDGCDAFCTYCIVPFARGRSRSMPLDNVLQSIQQLAQAGYHEVVLTGIHLGAYGRDLFPAANLVTLLNRIRKLELIDRVRLSSIEPLELSGEVIQTVAESDKFCRHLHIPLQSGDDRILKKMGRPYSRQTFHDLIFNIHQSLPNVAIGADTLIGFPGEDEKAFEHTYNLIESLPISYLHVFPFSVRPGTPAEKFADRVTPEIIKDRCEQMRRLGQAKRLNFYRKFIGEIIPVLIETKRDAVTGLLKGISSNYLPILIDSGDELKNKIVDVKIEKLEGNKLYGDYYDYKKRLQRRSRSRHRCV
jgi:threonylcarbamoyladenosine tRNA methylthiotransferase MtaB